MSGCSYITKAGGRCRAQPLPGESWCGLHHPANQGKVEAGRRQGGARRRRPTTNPADGMPLETVADVRAVLELALVDALALDPSAGRVRAVVSVAAEAARLIRDAEVDRKLGELEAMIANQLPGARIFR